MPKKPITWVGAVVVLAAGVFCFLELMRHLTRLPPSSSQSPWIILAAFATILVTLVAIYLWYWFNEKH
jgi:drug/metabolite transporter (DMT)-like permease